jgi:hypothetical protein
MKKKVKKTKISGHSKLTSHPKKRITKSPMQVLISKRAAELDMNPYAVAKAVRGKMSAQAVYDYLSGRKELSSNRIVHLLAVLRLEIRPKE